MGQGNGVAGGAVHLLQQFFDAQQTTGQRSIGFCIQCRQVQTTAEAFAFTAEHHHLNVVSDRFIDGGDQTLHQLLAEGIRPRGVVQLDMGDPVSCLFYNHLSNSSGYCARS